MLSHFEVIVLKSLEDLLFTQSTLPLAINPTIYSSETIFSIFFQFLISLILLFSYVLLPVLATNKTSESHLPTVLIF